MFFLKELTKAKIFFIIKQDGVSKEEESFPNSNAYKKGQVFNLPKEYLPEVSTRKQDLQVNDKVLEEFLGEVIDLQEAINQKREILASQNVNSGLKEVNEYKSSFVSGLEFQNTLNSAVLGKQMF